VKLTTLILWVRCNLHPRGPHEGCRRCQLALDMNARQAQALEDTT
jgi:hypothetical protein